MDDQVPVTQQAMLDDVLSGLRQSQKQLPSKYFYDERGSRLFEKITQLEEYYPSRTERAIMERNIDEISGCIGPEAMMIELGSGSSQKTRLLLDRLSLKAYVPVDISENYLLKVVHQLRRNYPRISIIPVFADYTSPFQLPGVGGDYQKQVVFYPGSTIGNFHPWPAQRFLEMIASLMDDDSGMLVGVDHKKDTQVLEAAYNDAQGITIEFNKNILKRINRELDADFDIGVFKHKAFYNEEKGRVEMHLVSTEDQRVRIDGEDIYFEKGESIHTENSYKYSIKEFETLVSDWYAVEKVWTDDKDYFSLQYLSKR